MRRTIIKRALLALAVLVTPCAALAQTSVADSIADPYRWLEDVHGDRSMTWVKAENAKTAAVLEAASRIRTSARSSRPSRHSTISRRA